VPPDFRWAMYEAFMSLIMNLILAEYRYLNQALKNIFDVVQYDANECAIISKYNYNNYILKDTSIQWSMIFK